MFITKASLPRRTFLRGLGATLALPLLDAMVPALSSLSRTAATAPMRLGFVSVPNGLILRHFLPQSPGTWIRPAANPEAVGAVPGQPDHCEWLGKRRR